ncbi:MAG: hypothetical protein AAF721_08130 [Myxococcota bacterium]
MEGRMRVVVGVALVASAACAVPTESLEVEEQPLGERVGAVVPEAPDGSVWAPRPAVAAEAVEAPPEPEPAPEPALPTGARVRPALTVSITGEREGCTLKVSASGFPAYDPATDRVVVLHRSAPQLMGGDVGTLELMWFDGASGEVDEVISIFEAHQAYDCARAHRKAQRQVRASRKALARAAFEVMEPVAVEWLVSPVTQLEAIREMKAEMAEEEAAEAAARAAAGEPPLPPEETAPEPAPPVQVFSRNGNLIARIAGVKVLERHPTSIDTESISVDSVHGHRASGTVVITEIDCAGDSCSCDPASSFEVVRWQPSTLQHIDEHPCLAEAGYDDECEIESVFGEGSAPWQL